MARLLLLGFAEEQRKQSLLRIERRHLRDASNPLQLPEKEFIANFRLSKAGFQQVLEELSPYLPQARRKTAVRNEIKILAALNFFANGSYQRTVGASYLCNMSQPTFSKCLHEVTDALNVREVLRNHIKFPSSQREREIIMKGFMEKFSFPGVIGCIDGTHVAIIRPTDHEEAFFNRKSYHSLNVLIICDAHLKILHVDASFGGASHDSFVWNQCPLKGHLERLQRNREHCWLLGQHVDITPVEAVRRIGDQLSVLCKVPYPIDSCRMNVGGVSYRLIPENLQGDVVYTGQGLKNGECGALIKNIKEEWNGNISCALPPPSGNIELVGNMRLLVARAPGEPTLFSTSQPSFKDGDKFSAQCVVPNGRPAAKITWFLVPGVEEPLLHGTYQPVVTSEPGSDLQTISQNVTRTLTDEDDTKILICRAEHEALEKPMEARRQLIVQYPPKRQEAGPITIFGLKLGAEGRLNVTVRANPKPSAEWTMGDQVLAAPRQSDDGQFTAIEPLLLGNGYYNITLVLARITKEDVDRTYYLRVDNGLGREEFAVRISTMDEPAGVELDTGAIVGIVVGVLILLVSIFLVVFAFATDRWCFAGRRRDNTKSSGESDTESAVGGRERSRLAGLTARVRAVLPRAKDKVQATEAQTVDTDDKPLSDDKKGVVYAELALGDQTSTEKPPPPSTEYAEIVYTDQPKENKESN